MIPMLTVLTLTAATCVNVILATVEMGEIVQVRDLSEAVCVYI